MKVFLADDRNLFIEGLRNLLSSYGFEVTEMTGDVSGMAVKAKELETEAVMINIAGDDDTWLDIVRLFKTEMPTISVIAFTDSEENLLKAEENGVPGYLIADVHMDELLKKLREIDSERALNRETAEQKSDGITRAADYAG
jgi:two-component system NarL family response regulator